MSLSARVSAGCCVCHGLVSTSGGATLVWAFPFLKGAQVCGFPLSLGQRLVWVPCGLLFQLFLHEAALSHGPSWLITRLLAFAAGMISQLLMVGCCGGGWAGGCAGCPASAMLLWGGTHRRVRDVSPCTQPAHVPLLVHVRVLWCVWFLGGGF